MPRCDACSGPPRFRPLLRRRLLDDLFSRRTMLEASFRTACLRLLEAAYQANYFDYLELLISISRAVPYTSLFRAGFTFIFTRVAHLARLGAISDRLCSPLIVFAADAGRRIRPVPAHLFRGRHDAGYRGLWGSPRSILGDASRHGFASRRVALSGMIYPRLPAMIASYADDASLHCALIVECAIRDYFLRTAPMSGRRSLRCRKFYAANAGLF